MQTAFWKKYWASQERTSHLNSFNQVGRTIKQQPPNQKAWGKTLTFVRKKMEVTSKDTLVDICCGNGILSLFFSDYVKEIFAIDYSKPLLDSFVAKDKPNVSLIFNDINTFDFNNIQYNKVIFYFSIQHFTETEVVKLLRKLKDSISENGVIYIGDIPDVNLKWDFFCTTSYKADFFSALEKNESIIGNWFQKDFFINASNYLGFKECTIIKQPEYMFFHKYRFDVLLKK